MNINEIIVRAVVTLIQGASAFVTGYAMKELGFDYAIAVSIGGLVATTLSVIYNVTRELLAKKDVHIPCLPTDDMGFSGTEGVPSSEEFSEN